MQESRSELCSGKHFNRLKIRRSRSLGFASSFAVVIAGVEGVGWGGGGEAIFLGKV